ncbi:MAG TPA: hypothetical protein VGG72_05935 [Bryobacteraceae bacterium]|jgi:hypothetical protein
MAENQDFQQRIARIEKLTRALDGTSDPAVRAWVKELTESVMNLNGTAIHRILEVLHERGSADTIDTLGKDPLVRSVLVLYGLHPLDLKSRVIQVIERLEPTFRKYQVQVELTGVEDTVVRLKIGEVQNASAGRAVKSAIEDEMYEVAPDVTRIEGLGGLSASELVGIQTSLTMASVAAKGPHA